MSDTPPPNPPPSPGDAIQAALDRRTWTHDDLARVLGRPRPAITSLVRGNRGITPELAVGLAAALGETASYWLSLDAAHSLAKVESTSDDVRRRAILFGHAPIKEMERRGWIAPAKDDAALEKELRRFYALDTIDSTPHLRLAARQSVSTDALNSAQVAWCYRAAQLARCVQAASYDRDRLVAALPALRELARSADSARRVPRFLAEVGVRLVIVEKLARTRMDGAAIFVHGSPIIALTLRYDRIDNFWHTLCHEVQHIVHSDGEIMLDVDLFDEEDRPWSVRPDVEKRADEGAASFLVPADEMKDFIFRIKPLYSRVKINQFANRMKIHPGIVVGQLQRRGGLGYHAHRDTQVKVRDTITERAMTDGFGHTPTGI